MYIFVFLVGKFTVPSLVGSSQFVATWPFSAWSIVVWTGAWWDGGSMWVFVRGSRVFRAASWWLNFGSRRSRQRRKELHSVVLWVVEQGLFFWKVCGTASVCDIFLWNFITIIIGTCDWAAELEVSLNCIDSHFIRFSVVIFGRLVRWLWASLSSGMVPRFYIDGKLVVSL